MQIAKPNFAAAYTFCRTGSLFFMKSDKKESPPSGTVHVCGLTQGFIYLQVFHVGKRASSKLKGIESTLHL